MIRVTAVTHRDDPIFQGSVEGHPVNESHVIGSLVKSTVIWNALDYNGVPGINRVVYYITSKTPSTIELE